MKKILVFAAAVAAMVACNKSEVLNTSAPQEIGFFTLTQNNTRGYVMKESFDQVVNPDTTGKFNSSVAGPAETLWRTMVVSAYNKTAPAADYFIGKDFRRGSSDIWHNFKDGVETALYWPIGKDLEFLAYSTSPTESTTVKDTLKATWDGAKKVSFKITKDQYQNDIMYAQASGNNRDNSSSSTSGLGIKFYHAQAWLTFRITIEGVDTATNIITVKKIVLEDVYNSGELNISYDANSAIGSEPKPVATWDFFTQNPTDVEVDDPWNVLGRSLMYHGTTNPEKNGVELNMLMPEQDHNNFILYYSLNNKTNSVVLPFEKNTETGATGTGFSTGDNGKWVMGNRYIYNITLSINEITFKPTVKTWVNVTGFDSNPQAL